MNIFAKVLVVSALTTLVALPALAAETAPADSKQTPPVASVTSPAAAAAPAAAAPVSESATAAKEQPVKIGYVDMAKIAAESKGGKAAAATLKAKSGKLRTKIEARQKQIEKQKEAIQAKLESLSPKERDAKAKEFQKKLEDFQKLLKSSDREMQEVQEKLTEDLYKEIKKASASYATSHGYTAILEQKAVLFMAQTVEPRNLTEEVIDLLDQKPQTK